MVPVENRRAADIKSAGTGSDVQPKLAAFTP
jgi:hypothetical protein